MFADATAVIKFASTATSFAGNSLKQAVSAMSRAVAICEEFCSEVESSVRLCEMDDFSLEDTHEIKCCIAHEYFTPLVERLLPIGYCCTQIQKDSKEKECVVWFEPMSPE